MDADNKPSENVSAAVRLPASDKNVEQWRMILLVLCAVGMGLIIGILALQVREYLFYKAPPDVWPQPGAGTRGALSAPAPALADASVVAMP